MDPIIQLIYNGVETKRFHKLPTLRNETVGHHQGLVMALLHYAYPNVRRAVLRYAAFHDLAEHVTGDIPSDTKRASPEIKNALEELEASVYRQAGLSLPTLDENERNVFKRCDNVAGMLTCYREYQMGNVSILVAFHKFKSYYDILRQERPSNMTDWDRAGHGVLDQAVNGMAMSCGCRDPYLPGEVAELMAIRQRLMGSES